MAKKKQKLSQREQLVIEILDKLIKLIKNGQIEQHEKIKFFTGPKFSKAIFEIGNINIVLSGDARMTQGLSYNDLSLTIFMPNASQRDDDRLILFSGYVQYIKTRDLHPIESKIRQLARALKKYCTRKIDEEAVLEETLSALTDKSQNH